MFDAIVLADGPTALTKVVGLTLAERGRRVAIRAGARRVLEDRTTDADALLVIRASDQVVHTPLVAPLVAAGVTSIAVGPDGEYAGALFATGADVATVLAGLAAGDDDRAIAARLDAKKIEHGAIARHAATTRDERRGAAKMLYRIVHKPQDNAITRYLYRPLSFPLTKMFVQTPITPNQISILTGVLVGLGLWLVARGSMNSATLGTGVILFASYVDCCDGEVARLKLLSSKFGAWLDTIIDELSSLGYVIVLGWHCHLWFGRGYLGDLGFDPWIAGMWIGAVTYVVTIYCIYYNIIVVVGSANSQDYIGRFEVIPGDAPGTVRLSPVATQAIATRADVHPVVRFIATYIPYMVRRDFIAWMSLALVALHLSHITFGFLVVGGVVTSIIVAFDHLHLRRQRRQIARDGQVLVVRA